MHGTINIKFKKDNIFFQSNTSVIFLLILKKIKDFADMLPC